MSKASKSKSPQSKGEDLTNTFEDELRSLTQINPTTVTPQGSAKKSQKNTPKAEASPAPSKGNQSAQKSLPASAQKQKTPLKNTPIQQEENNDSPVLEQEDSNELNAQVPSKQATPKGSVQKSNKNTPVQTPIKGSEQKSKKSLPGSAQKSVNELPEADEELIITEETIKTPQQSAKKSVQNASAQKSQQKSVPASVKKSVTRVPAFEPEVEVEAEEQKQEEVIRTPQKSAKNSAKNTPVQSRPVSAKKQATPAKDFEEEVVEEKQITPKQSASNSAKNTPVQSRPASAKKQATPAVQDFEEEIIEEKQITPKQSANKSNKNTPVNGKASQQKSAQKQKTPVKEDIEIEDAEDVEENAEEGDEMEEEVADEIADEDDDDDLGIDNFDEEDLQAGENEEEAEEVDDEEKQRIKEENIRKAIEFRQSQEKKGVVYLSSLPPYMKVSQLRKLFCDYGVERIYLNPEDESKRKFRVKTGGNKRRSYTEGWMEFNDKKKAKYVAAAFNNQKIGGKRRSFYTEDILNLKYLPKFKWENLTEKIHYDNKMRKEKMKVELSLAKKQHDHYLEQVEKGKKIMSIKKSKDAKRSALTDIDEVLKSAVEEPEEPEMKVSFDDEKDRIRRTFKQKKPKNF